MTERSAAFSQAVDELEKGIEVSVNKLLRQQFNIPAQNETYAWERLAVLLGGGYIEGMDDKMTKNRKTTYIKPNDIVYQEKDPVFAAMIDEMVEGIEISMKNNPVIDDITSILDFGKDEFDLAFTEVIEAIEAGIDEAFAALKAQPAASVEERDEQFAKLIDEIEESIMDITSQFLERRAS